MNRTWQITGALFGLLLLVGTFLAVSKIVRLTNAAYHAGRAPALARAGHLDEAIAESRLAVSSAPEFEPGHNNLGFYLFKKGQYKEAEAECRLAVRLAPADAHAHDSLGQVLSHTGHADEAVQQCREAVRLLPSGVHVKSLAYALWEAGQKDEARTDWQQVAANGSAEASAEAQRMLSQPPL